MSLDQTKMLNSDTRRALIAEKALEHAANIDHRTLAVSIDDDTARVAGCARDKREVDDIVEVVGSVPGIASVDNLTIVAPKQKDSDSRRATTVENAIQIMLPAGRVEVSVFGNCAVLSGFVKRHLDRGEAEWLALCEAKTEHVVDRLVVAG